MSSKSDIPTLLILAEKGCIWAGLVMVVLFSVGTWPMAGFIPPPLPSASPNEIAAFYRANSTHIIGGSLVVTLAPCFYLMFCTAISMAMERHCTNARFLSRIQLSGATINVVWFTVMALFWMVAAYRADADPNDIRLFNDMAWFIMVIPTGAFMLQTISVGVTALVPADGKVIFPRWIGFFNLWISLLFVPGMFSAFFKHGPIAWNGILSFWLEVAVFLLWLIVMFPVLIKSAPRTN